MEDSEKLAMLCLNDCVIEYYVICLINLNCCTEMHTIMLSVHGKTLVLQIETVIL